MSERKLVRVEQIDDLLPIKGKDRIELAVIGGWQVIVQKGLYSVGSKAVYCEVDSMLPLNHPAFESLASSNVQKQIVEGVQFGRIKTMKMGGVVSQGYCVPLSIAGVGLDLKIGTDITSLLGVFKYEAPKESQMNNGTGKGAAHVRQFPQFIPKTDQERVQNIPVLFNRAVEQGEFFEKSFKLDGSSMTVWNNRGDLGVASRNVGFKVTPTKNSFVDILNHLYCQLKCGVMPWKLKIIREIPAPDNAFTKAAREEGVLDALVEMYKNTGGSYAIQGELVGPSIQKNFEGVDKNTFYVYDVYNIKAGKYLLPDDRQKLIHEYGLRHVPLGSTHAVLLPVDIQTAIKDASGPSGVNGKYREGFVYKSMSRDFSFKVISNEYLLKEE